MISCNVARQDAEISRLDPMLGAAQVSVAACEGRRWTRTRGSSGKSGARLGAAGCCGLQIDLERVARLPQSITATSVASTGRGLVGTRQRWRRQQQMQSMRCDAGVRRLRLGSSAVGFFFFQVHVFRKCVLHSVAPSKSTHASGTRGRTAEGAGVWEHMERGSWGMNGHFGFSQNRSD